MQLREVPVSVPDGCQLIAGQAHFIKTVEDIFEALATSVPGLKFGVAFSEASGKALIRHDGTDQGCISAAVEASKLLGAGHSFVVFLKDAYPINVLHKLKSVDEVVSIYCATSNPVTFIVAETGQSRAILGVADGLSPKGVEGEADKEERLELLRKIGYKR
ncbi:MAG TPA: adenosine-specific kinase [Nitrososphaerales archaeon]|nr:adenosine-specific kinase [Nitrososphaerales archaeon]